MAVRVGGAAALLASPVVLIFLLLPKRVILCNLDGDKANDIVLGQQ